MNEEILKEETPNICNCGECEECIRKEGECTCGDCYICVAKETSDLEATPEIESGNSLPIDTLDNETTIEKNLLEEADSEEEIDEEDLYDDVEKEDLM